MATTLRFLQSVTSAAGSHKRGDEVSGWDDTDAALLVAAGYAEKVIDPKIGIYPGEVDDTDNGTSCDFRYAGNSFKAKQIIGAVAGTTPSLTGKIQESANGSDWTDVSGATFTAVTASNNYQEISFTKLAASRYLRHSRTVSGTTPTFVLCVTLEPVSSVA